MFVGWRATHHVRLRLAAFMLHRLGLQQSVTCRRLRVDGRCDALYACRGMHADAQHPYFHITYQTLPTVSTLVCSRSQAQACGSTKLPAAVSRHCLLCCQALLDAFSRYIHTQQPAFCVNKRSRVDCVWCVVREEGLAVSCAAVKEGQHLIHQLIIHPLLRLDILACRTGATAYNIPLLAPPQ
jgi:hypothetical protein